MVQLRQSPSGPPIVGSSVGDILIWNGTTWVTGPNTGSAPAAVRSQWSGDPQTMNLEIVDDIAGAIATFNAVPAGAYVFVQTVINVGILAGDGFINPRVVWDFGEGEEIIWEPGPVLWAGEGENPSFGKLPMQFQTPPLAALAATVTVKVQANGAGQIQSGNLQAELILA